MLRLPGRDRGQLAPQALGLQWVKGEETEKLEEGFLPQKLIEETLAQFRIVLEALTAGVPLRIAELPDPGREPEGGDRW